MYKLLLFLHKTKDENVEQHFMDFTLKYISEIAGKKIQVAEVESNPLLEKKFSKFCEVEFTSHDEWNKQINTKEGKALQNDLMEFNKDITVIFVEYK
jgi:hypothetical protein